MHDGRGQQQVLVGSFQSGTTLNWSQANYSIVLPPGPTHPIETSTNYN